MLEPAVRFYMQNYKTETGEIDVTEKEFLSIPFYTDPTIINPKVKNEMGKAGAFEFEVSVSSYIYSAIIQMKTFMRVTLFGKTIFRGRVLTVDQSPLKGVHTVHCEGDFSFFLDSFQYGVKDDLRPTISLYDYLRQIIDQHNAVVEPNRRFILGEVPGNYTDATAVEQRVVVPDEKLNQAFGDSSWNTSMDRLEGLLSDFGGYFRTRYDERTGGTYLDWFDKYYDANTNTQPVELAKNLIDLSGPAEVSNLFTVVIPIGRSQSEDVYISDYWPVVRPGHIQVPWIHVHELVTEELYTEAELNVEYHRATDYTESAGKFGQIWKIIDFPNANTPEKLFTYVKDWIKNNYMPLNTQWDVSALDLRFVDGTTQALYCGDRISLTAPEVDQTYAGMSIITAEYDLFNPDKNKYTIGMPNPETNASYGVPEKTARTTGSTSKASRKGSSGRRSNNDDDNDTMTEQDIAAIKAKFITQYSLETDFGTDIPYDDALAFCRFDEWGNEWDEDSARLRAQKAARAMSLTKQTKEKELRAEAARRGIAWNDPALVLEFTPELAQKQAEYRRKLHDNLVSTGLSDQVANELVYEKAGYNLLASFVDDAGNWTPIAYQYNVAGIEQIRQQAIRARMEQQGKQQSGVTKLILGVQNGINALGAHIGNFLNVENVSDSQNDIYHFFLGQNQEDPETGEIKKGGVLNVSSTTDAATDLGTRVMNWLGDLVTASSKDTPKSDGSGDNWLQQGWNFLRGKFIGGNRENGGSFFGLFSDSAAIDGDEGSVGLRTVDKDGNPIGETTLDGWQITLNKPYRYTAEIEVDGKMEVHEFVVPDHTIAVDDIHFTKRYDSLRAILAVVDVLLADYAQINSLVALQADIGNVHMDIDSLSYSFSNLEGQYNTLRDTASAHERTLSDLQGQYNTLKDTVSTHERTLSTLSGQYNTLKDTVSTHERTLSDLQGQYNTLKDTVSTHERTLSNLSGDYNTLKDTVSTHERTLSTLSGEYNTLKDTVSTHERTLSNVTGQYNTLVDTVSQHSRTLSSMSGLESRVTQTESTISAIVTGSGSNAKVKPAQIVAAITDDDGNLVSEVGISADRIILSGTTTINDIFGVNNNYILAKKTIYVQGSDGSTIISGTSVRTDTVYTGTNRLLMKVVDVQPSTSDSNELIITYYDGTTKTFRKAAGSSKVKGTWASGKYRVVADESGQDLPIEVELTGIMPSGSVRQTDASGTESSTGKYVALDYTINYNNGTISGTSTGKTVTAIVSASKVYNTGFDDVAAPTYDNWTSMDVAADTISNVIWFKTDDKKKDGTTRRGSRRIYLTGGTSWSNGKTSVYMRDGSNTGSIVGMKTVDASSVLQTNRTYTFPSTLKTYTVEPSSGGYIGMTKVDVDATAVYNAGFDAVGYPQPVSEDGSGENDSTTNKYFYITYGVADRTNGTKRTYKASYYVKSGTFDSSTKQITVGVYGATGGWHLIRNVTIDAESIYNSGFDAVTTPVVRTYNAGSDSGNYRYFNITVSTDAKTDGTNRERIYYFGALVQSSFNSSHQMTISIRGRNVEGQTSGNTWVEIRNFVIDASSVYQAGVTAGGGGSVTPSITISAFTSDTGTRDLIPVTATAGSNSTSVQLKLDVSTYNSGATPCVNLINNSTSEIVGRIQISGGSTSTQKVSGSWSSGTYKVQANSSGQSLPISVSLKDIVASGNSRRTTATGATSSTGMYMSQDYYIYYDDGSDGGASTGKKITATVNATTLYNAGYDASATATSDDDWSYTRSSSTTYNYTMASDETLLLTHYRTKSNGTRVAHTRIIKAPKVDGAGGDIAGNWSGNQYVVTSGGAQVARTDVQFKPEADTGDNGHIGHIKLYHDDTSVEANRINTLDVAVGLTNTDSSTRAAVIYAYGNVIASVSTQSVYQAGYDAVKLAESWDSWGKLTITKSTSGRTTREYQIGGKAVITYSSSTHTYTAYATGTVDGTLRGDANTAESADEAYQDGLTEGGTRYRTSRGTTAYASSEDDYSTNRQALGSNVVITGLTEFGRVYRINTQYQDVNGNWQNSYPCYVETPLEPETPEVSHSPSASATFGWTGSISGRTKLGTISASDVGSRTYILIDAKCGGTTKKYYYVVN